MWFSKKIGYDKRSWTVNAPCEKCCETGSDWCVFGSIYKSLDFRISVFFDSTFWITKIITRLYIDAWLLSSLFEVKNFYKIEKRLIDKIDGKFIKIVGIVIVYGKENLLLILGKLSQWIWLDIAWI